MNEKRFYCSECLKECLIKHDLKNPINIIANIWNVLLTPCKEKEKSYSMCCNSETLYLNIKERIIMELENG